mmetsp:Transcript_77951/g.226154  ORF Transcript_77951/g.226154 Transcript_77951/m.226154 type:complete len:294 (-) Transcript_77951:101-982(-)
MGQVCSSCNSGEGVPIIEDTFSVPEAGVTFRVRNYRKFGWKRDLPDHRDRVLVLHETKKRDLPRKCDLRPKEHFEPYDQGDLGSCTANAIAACIHFNELKQNLKAIACSRLFIYYNERALEGSCDQDAGASLRDGMKCCQKLGACSEDLWPYDEEKFTVKPTSECYTAALKCTVKEYAKVNQTLDDLRACLNEGFPFVFGFIVCDSFFDPEVAKTGVMSMPKETDEPLGGHAVMCVGYDDEKKVFIVRNSWGPDWGLGGYFLMPYDYMCWDQLVHDIWAIRCVDGVEFATCGM